MPAKKTKKESLLEVIARNVASIRDDMAMQNDVAMATKNDITSLRTEMKQGFEAVDRQLRDKATKDDIRELENKLIEDTGAVTGVEQKHYRSHAQRIARLEKTVFKIA